MDRFSKKNVKNLEKKLYPLTLLNSIDDLIFAGLKFRECIELISKFKFTNPFDLIDFHKKYFEENLYKIKHRFKEIKKRVFIGKSVEISEKADLDSTESLIIIDNNVKIPSYAYIKAPCFLGRNTIISPFSIIRGSYIGKFCKIGGEVANSIILDYSNKAHYGYLGSSYVGTWVNIGAGATNSNLKNTYGKVKIEFLGKRIKTNFTKLGCIIGDYSKLSIGSLIMCGKIIGVNSHIYGIVTENVPSFVIYRQGEIVEFKLEKALEIQKRVFKRRGKNPTKKEILNLKKAFKITQQERKYVFVS